MATRKKKQNIAIVYALLAAIFYGFSAPLAKILLKFVTPYMMSSLLYFGAGFGMLVVHTMKKKSQTELATPQFLKKDFFYIGLVIILDIVAPILLMFGLLTTTASNASLLNNFEIVFTTIIAMVFFKEVIGKRMWLAILLIIISGFLLTLSDLTSLEITFGSLFVLAASLCWGLENNCTRILSKGNPLVVVIIKGLGSGLGALLIAIFMNQASLLWYHALLTLLLGFLSYGMSLYYYIQAQRHLGAARTSAYYATAPFVGSIFSFIVLGEVITLIFIVSFIVMVIGTGLAIKENKTTLPMEGIKTDTNLNELDGIEH